MPKNSATKLKRRLDAGNYEKAIELYEALEARYPFGEYRRKPSSMLLTPILKMTNPSPPSPPLTALSKSIHEIPVSIMPII